MQILSRAEEEVLKVYFAASPDVVLSAGYVKIDCDIAREQGIAMATVSVVQHP